MKLFANIILIAVFIIGGIMCFIYGFSFFKEIIIIAIAYALAQWLIEKAGW